METDKRYNRRSFIGKGLLSTGALVTMPLAGEVVGNTIGVDGLLKSNKIFLSESGVLKGEDLFIVGALEVDNALATHERNLKKIRDQHSYRTRLTYRSNDRFKNPFAKDVIDYFLDTPSLHFSAYACGESGKGLSPQARQALRLSCYEKTLATVKKDGGEQRTIVTKSQTSFGPYLYFKDQVRDGLGFQLEVMDSRNSNLLQLVDLITGCIRADICTTASKNRFKLEINKHFHKGLNIDKIELGTRVMDKFILHLP